MQKKPKPKKQVSAEKKTSRQRMAHIYIYITRPPNKVKQNFTIMYLNCSYSCVLRGLFISLLRF